MNEDPTKEQIAALRCPWCADYGRMTALKPVYTRPGWLVGRCDRCKHDHAAWKLRPFVRRPS